MIANNEAALIAEYERLRRELDELNVRTEWIDARLVELEKLLPDHYVYLGDPPLESLE